MGFLCMFNSGLWEELCTHRHTPCVVQEGPSLSLTTTQLLFCVFFAFTLQIQCKEQRSEAHDVSRYTAVECCGGSWGIDLFIHTYLHINVCVCGRSVGMVCLCAKRGWLGTQTRMIIALAVQSSKQEPDKGPILATNLDITVFFVMSICWI